MGKGVDMGLCCKQPDRDEPGLECGYPLPCPYHTVALEDSKIIFPEYINVDTISPIMGISEAINKGQNV